VSGSRNYFLTTARLGFGHWSAGDLTLATTLWGDPMVTEFLGPFSPEQISARLSREIEMMATRKVQYWPVFLLSTRELAGCAGLRPYGDDEQVLELGFHLRPAYWGQGIAHEAASAVIAFAFESLQVKRLFAGHHPENLASERLLRKLGFRFTHQEVYPPTGLLNPAYRLVNPKST
jgi:[ribosomal protein S5]-alanine N-acetyltransferase